MVVVVGRGGQLSNFLELRAYFYPTDYTDYNAACEENVGNTKDQNQWQVELVVDLQLIIVFLTHTVVLQ